MVTPSWRDRLGRPPRGPLLMGFAGSVAILLGSFGAAGTLVRDPVLTNSPLGFWRYGHGQSIAAVLVSVGVWLMVLAWVRLGRGVLAHEVGGRAVLTTAVVWLLPMLCGPPLFTRDVFSYLAQGALPLAGFDPYAYGPDALPGAILDNVHPWWQDVPAPYGPLFILIAKGVVAVTGEHAAMGVILMRLAMLPGLALFVWAVPELTRRMGGRVPVALWIAVANPVVVVHLVGGVHNDLLLLGMLAAGAALALRGRPASGIALVTAAAAVKASAGLALPFLVLVWAGQLRGSWLSRVVRAAALGLLVAGVVFGALSLLAGVGIGWVFSLGAGGAIVAWYSLPTAIAMLVHTIAGAVWPGVSIDPFLLVFRGLAMLVLLAFAIQQWWKARDGGPEAIRRAGIALLAAAVLGPALLSWYPSWGIALLAATAWTAFGLRAVAFFSVLLMFVSYPNGNSAHTDGVLLTFVAAMGLLAAYSLYRRDPLRLRELWAAVPSGWSVDRAKIRSCAQATVRAAVRPDFWSRWHLAEETRPGTNGTAPAPRRRLANRVPLLAGLAGTTLMALGGFGAAGTLVRDPVLTNSPVGFWQYGHGRDIALGCIYVGVILLAYAWMRLGRDVLADRAGGRAVVTTAAVWMLPMLVTPPLYTRDVYYYLAQGALPLAGIDPYAAGPSAVPGLFTDNVASVWLDTPAPYGPLFMVIATGIAWLVGNNIILGVLVTRLVLLAGLALIVWALPELARRMGGRASVALWMVIANPVTIAHVIGGAHNDALVGGLLAAGCLLALRGKHVGGIALVTMAAAIKITAAFALPFLVLVWAAHLAGSPVKRIVRATAAGLAVFAVVFGVCSWPMGGPLGWLPGLSAPATVIHWYSPPTGLGLLINLLVTGNPNFGFEPFVAATRLIGGLLLVVIAVRQWWAARDGGPDAVRRAGVVLLAATILGPTLQAWYPIWGMVLLAAVAWRPRGLSVYLGLSLFFMILDYPDGKTAQGNPLLIVGAALCLLAAVALHRPNPLPLLRRVRLRPVDPPPPSVEAPPVEVPPVETIPAELLPEMPRAEIRSG